MQLFTPHHHDLGFAIVNPFFHHFGLLKALPFHSKHAIQNYVKKGEGGKWEWISPKRLLLSFSLLSF